MEKEDFIKKDEKHMGECIDVIEGEDKLIKQGLLDKTKEQLEEMAKDNPRYKQNLSKEQLVDILVDDLNKR